MSKEKKDKAEKKHPQEEAAQAVKAETAPAGEAPEAAPEASEVPGEAGAEETRRLQEALSQKEEQYLRLAAEYDNYRKRTAKEKDAAWSAAKAETVKALLPVYDNLERALRQETVDEAYRKGVEMTMTQLKKILGELGVEEIAALGAAFDANLHAAVMHVEDPELGENVVKEVYQAGFRLGDQVIRYAMVVVAN